MARLPLQTLPAFEAVARLQNLRQAADELHLTPSAISQQIRLLEHVLGHPVFDRHGRRVALNAAGMALQRAVQSALAQLQEGRRQAQEVARGKAHHLRLTMLNSLAQRWLLPRMPLWRERHPHITLELHVSPKVVDLQREGFHAALRQGQGPWKGLHGERLFESPLVVVGSPAAAARLHGKPPAALADEPLIGDPDAWGRWFALIGVSAQVRPVADFNDAALMLQAAEQDIGIALARELLAADALRSGQLVRLAKRAMALRDFYPYWLVYPPEHADWPPLQALKTWLAEELSASAAQLAAPAAAPAAAPVSAPASPKPRRRAAPATPGTAAARRSGSRSHAPSAPAARRRG